MTFTIVTLEYLQIMQSLDTSKLKILIVTPWYGAFAGGAEVLARGLAENFQSRGFQVEVLSTLVASPYDDWWQSNKGLPKKEIINGVLVSRYDPDGGENKFKYQSVVQKMSRGETLSQQDKFDFFYKGITSTYLIASVKQYLESGWRVIALPYFQSLTHNLVAAYPGLIDLVPCLHDEPEFYWQPVEKLIEHGRALFFNSPEEKLLSVRVYGSKFLDKIKGYPVVGAGLDTQKMMSRVKVSSKLPDNYVLYVGRKEKGKNVHILSSWHEHFLKTQNKRISLVYIGGGDREIVPNSASFIDLGYVSDGEKDYLIGKSICVVNLSDNESFSYVIMESWLNKKPVIVSSKCEVTCGHVKRSIGGFCVDNKDSYSTALKIFSENADISTQLGNNGNEYVLSNYSWDNVIGKYVSYMNELA